MGEKGIGPTFYLPHPFQDADHHEKGRLQALTSSKHQIDRVCPEFFELSGYPKV